MKLEPKAKPIRIRIKLGNSEYSSWDSVKKSNFSIKELYPLFKDGRLERWLEQIGEEQLAQRTGELSKQCRNGDMKDYIQFLSLFFKEVEVSLSDYKGEEWYLNDYLSSAPLDTIKIIYAKTMDVEEIDWGEEFTKLVTNEEKYKELFTYLERDSRNNPQPERCGKITSTFYSNCSQKGYQWASAFKDEMSIDYVEYIYQNKYFQIPDVDWGILFADCVKDWATDSEKVEKIIEHNHKNSFYKRCAENGIEGAKKKLVPWYELANSDEYEIIIKAINDFDKSQYYFNRDNFNYINLKSVLGKQILDFLQSLRYIFYDIDSWGNNNSYGFDYLENVTQIMINVYKREKDSDERFYFNSEQTKELNAMRKRGDELAGELADYALKNSEKTYWQIALHAVGMFRAELNNKRR